MLFFFVMSFHLTRNGILAVDASDDSDIVFREVEAPPAKCEFKIKKEIKIVFEEFEALPLASKALVRLNVGGLQVALNAGISLGVSDVNDDHCIHGRERCKVAL